MARCAGCAGNGCPCDLSAYEGPTIGLTATEGEISFIAEDSDGAINIEAPALVGINATGADGAVTMTATNTNGSIAILAGQSISLQTTGAGSQVDIAANGVGSTLNVILRSPDGSSFLITVSNAGVLGTQAV